MSTTGIVFVVVIAGALAGSIYLERCYVRIARGLLQSWAAKAGFTLLGASRRWFETGPFPLPMKGQVIFRFSALDANRCEIAPWARACLACREKFEVRLD